MNKKVPQRQCIGCRVSRDKKDLVRIVRASDGTISVDLKGKANGRGAYLCKDPECLSKAIKTKALERAFDVNIPPSVYESLKEEYKSIE